MKLAAIGLDVDGSREAMIDALKQVADDSIEDGEAVASEDLLED